MCLNQNSLVKMLSQLYIISVEKYRLICIFNILPVVLLIALTYDSYKNYKHLQKIYNQIHVFLKNVQKSFMWQKCIQKYHQVHLCLTSVRDKECSIKSLYTQWESVGKTHYYYMSSYQLVIASGSFTGICVHFRIQCFNPIWPWPVQWVLGGGTGRGNDTIISQLQNNKGSKLWFILDCKFCFYKT